MKINNGDSGCRTDSAKNNSLSLILSHMHSWRPVVPRAAVSISLQRLLVEPCFQRVIIYSAAILQDAHARTSSCLRAVEMQHYCCTRLWTVAYNSAPYIRLKQLPIIWAEIRAKRAQCTAAKHCRDTVRLTWQVCVSVNAEMTDGRTAPEWLRRRRSVLQRMALMLTPTCCTPDGLVMLQLILSLHLKSHFDAQVHLW